MDEERAYTLEQIREFRRLKVRLGQIAIWQESISEQLAKLERQKRHAEEEAAAIEKRIVEEFSGLESVAELFSTSPVPDSALTPAETSYVTKDKKRLLLKKILQDFRTQNPKAQAVSYSHVKKELAAKYGIKTRSIANFFLGILSDYETTGGNKNKAIVLP